MLNAVREQHVSLLSLPAPRPPSPCFPSAPYPPPIPRSSGPCCWSTSRAHRTVSQSQCRRSTFPSQSHREHQLTGAAPPNTKCAKEHFKEGQPLTQCLRRGGPLSLHRTASSRLRLAAICIARAAPAGSGLRLSTISILRATQARQSITM